MPSHSRSLGRQRPVGATAAGLDEEVITALFTSALRDVRRDRGTRGERLVNAVETHLLGKRYDRTWALRDCTLAISAVRVVALAPPPAPAGPGRAGGQARPLARHNSMAALMLAVAQDGISVLLSSHVVAELERVSDYLIVLAHGTVRVAGDVQDLSATRRREPW